MIKTNELFVVGIRVGITSYDNKELNLRSLLSYQLKQLIALN